ncbi:two-component system chemotaxis response regulator CheB [Prosthecobacter fusiformis]|uniref:protein-glutamate methylesterase n=1 Tax=Prosthecobacter fusiformis TaxID=48464 RepID=A0A4R7RZF2_9BACT|nr:chemotaxis-specific protein-glutamate methyltransferase CheB [Prosthecobacter fusiformis]TDU71340.1 two-component system chemotaxis response regulator CheB [Prosthecobacter fusiformis]
MKKVSVMIVEDSQVVSEFLHHIINRDPRLQVIASVRSGEEALKTLANTRPDIISLDIRLPGMNGLEVTQRIMNEFPTPIVVVSSDVEDDELKISMNALRAGALSVVQKPVGLRHADYERLSSELCTKLAIMSEVRVIRQRYRTYIPKPEVVPARQRSTLPAEKCPCPRVLGMVASTGGPNAIVQVLNSLPADFPAPILLVQHITPGFVRGFVTWLGGVVPGLKVVEAQHCMPLQAGTVYVAPADVHMAYAEPFQIQLLNTPPVNTQKPSGTVLLKSLTPLGTGAAAVLLTGMGEDGALGMRDMHQAGAYTIAQDEATSVVYGMPAAAVKLGAATATLPLEEIGARLALLFNPPSASS